MNKTPESNAECRILLGVKLSFVAEGIIKLQTLTLNKGKYAFNVQYLRLSTGFQKNNIDACIGFA